MEYQYASYSDIGKRDNNEDSLCVKHQCDSLIAIVADGVGGHANGEIASRMAVNAILNELENKEIDEDDLIYAILRANDEIRDSNCSGNTTVAALWLKDDYAVAAHVGDSRIYQFRDGKIIFQSVDHSVVQMAVLVGELPPDAVRHHKDRNKIFRALGENSEAPKVDSTELTVRPGDCFLLCSDGFWEPVTEADMLRAIRETDTPEAWLDAMQKIVVAANDPKQDNYTTVVLIAQ